MAEHCASPPDGRKAILIIDNDRCTRELLAVHLANAGYSIGIAEDAVVAGRLILERAPALVIMDVDIPFISGYELAALLKTDERTRSIPVMFLTSSDDVVERTARLGAVAFVRKPIAADKLLDLIALYVN